MLLVSFFMPLVFLVLVNFLFIYLFRKKLRFEQALPLSLMGTALAVYLLTVLFHNINLSFYIVITSIAVGFIIFFKKDDGRIATLKNLLVTPGFIAFLVLYAFLFILNIGRVASQWDEWMSWMPFVQDMLRINDFYTSPSNAASMAVGTGTYPPIIQIFETIWVRLSGSFGESFIYNGYQLIALSMLWPFLANITWKSKRPLLVACFVALSLISSVLVINLYDEAAKNFTFFSAVLVDSLLGLVFVYGLWLVFVGRKTILHLMQLSITLSFLILVKDVGMVLAGLIVMYYIITLLLESDLSIINLTNTKSYIKNHRNELIVIGLCIILPLACYLGWSVQKATYLSRPDSIQKFSVSDIQPWKIPDILFHRYGTESQQISAYRFIDLILHDYVTLNTNLLKITYLQITIVLVIVMFIISTFLYRKTNLYERLLYLQAILIVGWVGYIFLMMNLYLFGGFMDLEKEIIVSGNRYLGMYLLAYMLLIVGLLVYKVPFKETSALLYLLVYIGILWGIVFNQVPFNSITPYKLYPYLSVSDPSTVLVAKLRTAVQSVEEDADFTEDSVVTMLTCDIKAFMFEPHYLRYALRYSGAKAVISKTLGDGIRSTDHSTYLISLCGANDIRSLHPAHERIDISHPIKDKYQAFKFNNTTTLFEPI